MLQTWGWTTIESGGLVNASGSGSRIKKVTIYLLKMEAHSLLQMAAVIALLLGVALTFIVVELLTITMEQ